MNRDDYIAYLEQLAEAADPKQLWRLSPFSQQELGPQDRQALDTAVALRRYAHILRDMKRAADKRQSLVLTRLGEYGSAIDFIPMKDWHIRSHERRRDALASGVKGDGELSDQAEFELHCGDEFAASASGTRAQAWAEIQRYAAQYAQDGPVVIYEVTRKQVCAAGVAVRDGGRS